MLVLQDVETIITEETIGGILYRNFFWWKPEKIQIQYKDICIVTKKIEMMAKRPVEFENGFVKVRTEEGTYSFICKNPTSLQKYIEEKVKRAKN